MAKKLETLTNITIIAVALIAGTVLVRNHFFPRPAPPARPQPGTGMKVAIPGVDWAARGSTLLLALSPNCQYCTESAPFYRRLAAELSKTPVHLTAVFPDHAQKAREYLTSLGVPVDDVRQVAPASLPIRGTPTLLLVDRDGIVRRVWAGQLSAEAERDVIETAGATNRIWSLLPDREKDRKRRAS
jgi:hypothetical protein